MEILARLKQCRRSLELPRRLFAKAAGLDSSIIVRLELERMPLRFGIGRALCNAHSINPEWLATGEGDPAAAFGLPFVDKIQTNEDALFSSVLKEACTADFLEKTDVVARWKDSSSSFARGQLVDFWGDVIQQAFEKVPGEKMNMLDAKIRAVLERIIGRVPDHPAVKKWRQHFPKNNDLTKRVNPAKHEPVQNLWAGLKARIQKATASPGEKSALAEFLGVDLTQVSRWLSPKTKREPGADYTLKMLHWVQERESQ